jgi:hypothetical protein
LTKTEGPPGELANDALRQCEVEQCPMTFPEDVTEAYDEHLRKHEDAGDISRDRDGEIILTE